jgi:hypothetical protein
MLPVFWDDRKKRTIRQPAAAMKSGEGSKKVRIASQDEMDFSLPVGLLQIDLRLEKGNG